MRRHRHQFNGLLRSEAVRRSHRHQVRVVLGYQAGQDIDLAVERNEVVCRAFTLTAFFAREPFTTWRKKKFVNVLVQTGQKARYKEYPTCRRSMN